MIVSIYLMQDDFKDYSALLSQNDKHKLTVYLSEQVNKAKKFEIADKNEERNNRFIENADSFIKGDSFQKLKSLVDKNNENNNYVFVKEFVRNFVIVSKRKLSFKCLKMNKIDSISLLPENSINIPLDWDFSIDLTDNIVYIKNFEKTIKWMATPPEEEKIKIFKQFVNVLKEKNIKLKSEDFYSYEINKQRQKDLVLMDSFNFTIDELKKLKFIDKNNCLYKTKINEAIAFMIDKLYQSNKTKTWYASDGHKIVIIGDGKH